jgi:hypothetical protein
MCQHQAQFPLCVLPTPDNLGDNFNSYCNHVPLMSARFPFYYFFSISNKLGAKRTRKISRLSLSHPTCRAFRQFISRGFRFLSHDCRFWLWVIIYSIRKLPSRRSSRIRNYSALVLAERLSISISSCCSSQCQGHVKSQFALCCCSPLARSAILIVRKASPHTHTHTWRACADENSLKLHASADIT